MREISMVFWKEKKYNPPKRVWQPGDGGIPRKIYESSAMLRVFEGGNNNPCSLNI